MYLLCSSVLSLLHVSLVICIASFILKVADIDRSGNFGTTPLHVAAEFG